jgi:hypothetical protein
MTTLDTLERMARISPLSTWALFAVGVGAPVLQVGGVLVLWLGNWPVIVVKDQIMLVGVICIIQALASLAVVVSLSRTRVAAKGPGNFSFDLQSGPDAAPAPQIITTTTKIEGTPAP